MNQQELKKILQENPETIEIIDIRENEELLHDPKISEAKHIPLSELSQKTNTLDKNKIIVTVCKSGGRCMIANQILSTQGYNADMLEGGMDEWK